MFLFQGDDEDDDDEEECDEDNEAVENWNDFAVEMNFEMQFWVSFAPVN